MKKINKTVLLASTLFISSAITISNKSYADEDINALVKPSYDSLGQSIEEYKSEIVDTEADGNKENLVTLSQENPAPENAEKEGLVDKNTYEKALDDQKLETREQADKILEKSESSQKANEAKTNDESRKDSHDGIIYYDDTSLDAGLGETPSKSLDYSSANEDIKITEKNYLAPNASGYFVKNNNKVNYYENNKLVKNRNMKVNDKIYRADKTGAVSNPKNAWLNVGKDIYYTKEDGSISKGISDIKNEKYYFSMDGILQRNKKLITQGRYYEVGNTGKMESPANKWVTVNNNIYRTTANGTIAKGVSRVGEYDYMFDNDGKLQTNKKMLVQDKYYEVNKLGVISNPKNTWISLDGATYRTNGEGKIIKGPAEVNGNSYVFDNKTGAMLISKESITNGRYFKIDERGVSTNPKNSWITYQGKKYHTNNQGYVKEGVWRIDGKLYYFTKDGLASNTKVIQQGIEYQVDANGVATAISNRIAGEKSIDKAMEWMFVARDNKMTYNMGAKRTSTESADCSSAVYRSLIYGGFLEEGTYIGNTETLFSMGETGMIMKEIKESEIDHGDIFVAGIPGQSLGAGGHTGFILNKADDTIIHMNYSRNGVSVTPRKGYMGDGAGLPVRYYRLVGAKSNRTFVNKK